MKYKRVNSIISSSLGNILEWYDFGLFTIFSPIFSELFFPKQNAYTALIATFSVFAVGFICRPLGALLFGYLGDRYGRAKTIRLSILMISIPTLLIGCLPDYHSIGLLAPILLLLIRIWQGLSVGGEYSGNIVYLGELASSQHRSFLVSLSAVGSNVGIMLAMIVGSLVTYFFDDAVFKSWGWRVPYIISGIFCIIIYLTRLHIQESPAFLEIKRENKVSFNPLKNIFKNQKIIFFRSFGLVCMGSTFYYFSFIYLPMQSHEILHYSIAKTTHIETWLMALMVVLLPIAGWLSDKVGRYSMLVLNAAIISLSILPGLYLLHSGAYLVVMLFFTLASALEQGTTPAVLTEQFPVEDRYTGVAFAYNLANGFLGGTIPLICAWLTLHTHLFLAPGIYVTVCAVVTLLCAVILYRKKYERESYADLGGCGRLSEND